MAVVDERFLGSWATELCPIFENILNLVPVLKILMVEALSNKSHDPKVFEKP